MRYRCATSAWVHPMISNPTSKGKTSEAVILAVLASLGKHVLIPWGEERYDLALDEAGRLVRIQCKKGRSAQRLHRLQNLHHGCTATARRRRLRGADRRFRG